VAAAVEEEEVEDSLLDSEEVAEGAALEVAEEDPDSEDQEDLGSEEAAEEEEEVSEAREVTKTREDMEIKEDMEIREDTVAKAVTEVKVILEVKEAKVVVTEVEDEAAEEAATGEVAKEGLGAIKEKAEMFIILSLMHKTRLN